MIRHFKAKSRQITGQKQDRVREAKPRPGQIQDKDKKRKDNTRKQKKTKRKTRQDKTRQDKTW